MIGWIKEVEEMPGIEKIPEDKFREIFVSNPKNVLSTGSLFIVMVHFIMYIIIYCIKYYEYIYTSILIILFCFKLIYILEFFSNRVDISS